MTFIELRPEWQQGSNYVQIWEKKISGSRTAGAKARKALGVL
jgi:hypothetical protein